MNNISTHISYAEGVHTLTGLINIPNFEQLSNMRLLAEKVFEPLRMHIQEPIQVTSFFRSDKVNDKVGGVRTSQHLHGQAIDIKATGNTTNAYLFNWVKDNLQFDELIWEKGTSVEPAWIHISFKQYGNRNKILHL